MVQYYEPLDRRLEDNNFPRFGAPVQPSTRPQLRENNEELIERVRSEFMNDAFPRNSSFFRIKNKTQLNAAPEMNNQFTRSFSRSQKGVDEGRQPYQAVTTKCEPTS